ncbi:redoxin domain-containing protein [Candidatus Poribacteria bacterium]|nr:redoxin domain-containing protein [Candidatus Poribacteria bacterium]
MATSSRVRSTVCALAIGILVAGCGAKPAARVEAVQTETVEDFGLHDQRGDFHSLYYYSDASAVVLFVQGNGCPIVRNGVPSLDAIRAEYAPQGVVFLMLNANPQDDRDSVAEEALAYGIDYPILVDETQLVAASLGVTRTAEAFVIRPSDWRIVYRGPIDDRLDYEAQKVDPGATYLADALAASLDGRTPSIAGMRARGCLVALADAHADAPTYTGRVAGILDERCITCHVEGGIGPFAIESYEDARGWAPMIREVLRTRRMPPWQADPHVGTFANDISLTVEETQAIVRWVEAGAPRGEGPDALAASARVAPSWSLGEPDLIVTIDEQEMPATGIIDYRYLEIPAPVDRDVWVRGVQILPSNYAATHHVLVSIDYPEGFTAPWASDERWLDGVFAGYAPGAEAEAFPDGSGRILPAGSKLIFQLHYTATGRPETDATRLGIYFADEAPDTEYMMTGPVNGDIELPPGAKAYTASAERVFDVDMTLHGLFPHMHFRGKSFTYEAHYPDGSTELLLSTPNYNFNWQRSYMLAEPKVLPAGTKIVCRAVFDNSAQNRFNPDPTQTVTWGDQSFDEMLIGYMTVTWPRRAPAAAGVAAAGAAAGVAAAGAAAE